MPHLYQDFNENLDKALAISLYFDHHPENIRNAIGHSIKKFYFGDGRLSEETHQNLTNVCIFSIGLSYLFIICTYNFSFLRMVGSWQELMNILV